MRTLCSLLLTLIAISTSLSLGCDSALLDAPEPDARISGERPATHNSHRAEQPSTLKIAIYNVLYALAQSKSDGTPAVDAATLETAKQLQADVLLLQETNAAWKAALHESLIAQYGHCAFIRPKRYLPEGLATCSRWPIIESERIPPPGDWFPAQRIRLDTPHGPLDILNVHLAPAVAGASRWHAVHKQTKPQRRREIEALLAQPSLSKLAIIAGDFNEVPTGDLFTPLSAAGFANALDIADNHTTTWRWAGTDLAEQLDHVTYRRAIFQLVSVEVLTGGRSDHVPVVVTLKRR